MIGVYHEFISFCCANESKGLPELVDQFTASARGKEFNFHEFMAWKQSVESQRALLSQFRSYPFLRDYLFISQLGALDSNAVKASIKSFAFGSFILQAQIDYFSRHVNSNFHFNLESIEDGGLTASTSKCPFASRTSKSQSQATLVLDRDIFKIKNSRIKDVEICQSNESDLNIRFGPSINLNRCNLSILTKVSLDEFPISFDSSEISIVMSNATFKGPVLSNQMQMSVHAGAIDELMRFGYAFTAADLAFLFPSKVHVIKAEDIDLILNYVIYLNIFELPCDLDTIKAILPASKAQSPPSLLQAYSDVLTSEYIKEHPDLFHK
jgi:hypothetical protein